MFTGGIGRQENRSIPPELIHGYCRYVLTFTPPTAVVMAVKSGFRLYQNSLPMPIICSTTALAFVGTEIVVVAGSPANANSGSTKLAYPGDFAPAGSG